MGDKSKTVVYVGLSGGVDSSVTACILKNDGYKVVGVYMKNWATDLPGFSCPWRRDMLDAKRVAVQLGIPFKVMDFTVDYKQHVVDYMLGEYRKGRTPNPDLMCNQFVKFDVFLRAALDDGADLVATGHYARITDDGELLRGIDPGKDQSYFLARMPRQTLDKTLMPLGEMLKPEVRDLAREMDLSNADKKDSVGICFIGDIEINDFLGQFIDEKPGDIIGDDGAVLGQHRGLHLYTIGQRQGLGINSLMPHYVTAKDVESNRLFVSSNIDNENLWRTKFALRDLSWLIDPQGVPRPEKVTVQLRHLGQTYGLKSLSGSGPKTTGFEISEPVKAIPPGQSAVFYDGDQVLFTGIVS